MEKSLICYFSATKTTQKVVEELGKIIDGDLFEIEPVDEYTSSDLDWTNNESRTTKEKDDESFRPQIKNKVENLEDYHKIIIGFPVWWYKEPNIIDTFIEENNLENKQIYVFVTSGGSTVDGSFESLVKKYPHLNFISGKRLGLTLNAQEILAWLKEDK